MCKESLISVTSQKYNSKYCGDRIVLEKNSWKKFYYCIFLMLFSDNTEKPYKTKQFDKNECMAIVLKDTIGNELT